jgi:electron transfer flavoprotein beta subunit
MDVRRIGVALKLVDRRPEVDQLTAAVHDDERWFGASASDQAALEWALRLAEAWGASVLAVSASGPGGEALLREALAAGAHEALRVHLDPGADSEAVAAALADAMEGCAVVVCGDYSLDRGSGSVPAYLAARLGAQQALGLVQLQPGDAGHVDAVRRLDGGRRERLAIEAPAVLSVEGATARLRRAPLAAALRARAQAVPVRVAPVAAPHAARVTRPFRPRPRALAAPAGSSALERVVQLTEAHAVPAGGGDAVALDPAEAAARIVAALRQWGYLE